MSQSELRVVVADDSVLLREGLVRLLEESGFDVAARLTGGDDAPTVILVSSRDGSDFGPLVTRSGARGFVPKAELSGDRVQELLP